MQEDDELNQLSLEQTQRALVKKNNVNSQEILLFEYLSSSAEMMTPQAKQEAEKLDLTSQ